MKAAANCGEPHFGILMMRHLSGGRAPCTAAVNHSARRGRDEMSPAETNMSATFFSCLIRLVELTGNSRLSIEKYFAAFIFLLSVFQLRNC